MPFHRSLFAALVGLGFCWQEAIVHGQERQAYPIKMEPDSVRAFPQVEIVRGDLTLRAKDVAVTPIACEAGVTGAFLIGDGTFRFSPPGVQPIKGRFRAAMLRFHPADQPKVLSLEKASVVSDRAAFAMSQHLMAVVFRHCWHSGADALLPDEGTLAAVVYSREHGDLLLSSGGVGQVAYNFTENKQLYPKN